MNTYSKLFPEGLLSKQWIKFNAHNYESPVIGSIHNKDYPAVSGMPLGGLDTGCIDVETSGLFGYYTIFNSHVPRGGPMNYPFLGVSCGGKTWVMTTKKTKYYTDTGGLTSSNMGTAVHSWAKNEYIPPEMELEGTLPIEDIEYWGHYPIVDMEYKAEMPVSMGMRAFTPFIPGDEDASMLPAAMFEVYIRNTGNDKQQGTIAFSFAGPEKYEFRPDKNGIKKVTVNGGTLWGAGYDSKYSGYILACTEKCRTGGGLYNNGKAWADIDKCLPDNEDNYYGTSCAANYELMPGENRSIRFILSWYSPYWLGRGTLDTEVLYSGVPKGRFLTGECGKKDRIPASSNFFRHMYATKYNSALDAAENMAEHADEYLNRIIGWQSEIYNDKDIPDWLKDSLINILHLVTEDGLWAAAEFPIGGWCHKEDGLYGMIECPRGCPQIECIPCSFYGNIPVVYFFPKAALSTLRGYKAYQFSDGAAPWVFGGVTTNTGPVEMVYPVPGYQTTLNGPCYVDMVYRLWQCTGDDEILKEFYPSVKASTKFTMNLRPEYKKGDEIISMPTGNYGSEWFEVDDPGWSGMTSHVGGIHLANLLMAESMAKAYGDIEGEQLFREWFELGAASMENNLWNEKYYLNYYEPETGEKSDFIFGYQLDGEWMANFHGLYGAFPKDRVSTVLQTISECNVKMTKYGAANYTTRYGGEARVAGYGAYSLFPPELIMLAGTYIYHGEKEFGIELAKRCWDNIVNRQGLQWDQPNTFRGDKDTGERVFGADYYQNMMLWSLPAALIGKDISGPARAGGLVDRVIRAGRIDK